jgi:hypothetical protein
LGIQQYSTHLDKHHAAYCLPPCIHVDYTWQTLF